MHLIPNTFGYSSNADATCGDVAFVLALFLAWSPAAVLPVSSACTSFSGIVDKQEVQSPVMATETTEIKLLDETLSSLETNNEDYAHSTTSISISPAGSDDTTLAEGGVTQRDSFLPTAEHAEQPSQEQVFLSAELVAGEVDCKARSAQSKENAQNTPVSDTSSPAPGRRTMKLEDKNCSCCNIQFERHGRSFNRRAVFTFTTPETVRWAFPDAAVHRKSFLCETCAQSIRSKCRRRQSGKRFLWLRPAVSKQVGVCVCVCVCGWERGVVMELRHKQNFNASSE